jgi:hypothetical protein
VVEVSAAAVEGAEGGADDFTLGAGDYGESRVTLQVRMMEALSSPGRMARPD